MPESPLRDVCFVYRSDQQLTTLEEQCKRLGWSFQSHRYNSLVAAGPVVKTFFGKRGFFKSMYLRIVQALKSRKLVNLLGSPDRVVVLDYQLFGTSPNRFEPLTKLVESLRGCYSTFALATSDVNHDRLPAMEAGAKIVLAIPVDSETLRREFSAISGIEANARAGRVFALLEFIGGIGVATVLGAAFTALLPTFIDNWDPCWSAQIVMGSVVNREKQASNLGARWEELVLRIGNSYCLPKRNFDIADSSLHGLVVRQLPKRVFERIEVGKVAEIRFLIQIPSRPIRLAPGEKLGIEITGPWWCRRMIDLPPSLQDEILGTEGTAVAQPPQTTPAAPTTSSGSNPLHPE